MRLAAVVLVTATGCGIENIPFRCDDDSQCVTEDRAGLCEANGYCSFPDSACDSGRRYAPDSASDVARECVPRCIKKISAGDDHTCAIRVDGSVACWGKAIDGQLGNGATSAENYPAPVDVDSLVTPAADVSAGTSHTCVIREPEGSVWCFGSNTAGQLGKDPNASLENRLLTGPLEITRPSEIAAVQIAAGGAHTCARGGWGVACWGANPYGQLGTGAIAPFGAVNPIKGLAGPVNDIEEIAVGAAHSCADPGPPNPLKCWGDNRLKQILPGSESPELEPSPVDVKLSTTSLALGVAHTCAVADGKVRCWGSLLSGVVPLGNIANPVEVPGNPVQVSAGNQFNCAVLEEGQVACWGTNEHGQLGSQAPDGHQKVTPTLVEFERPIRTIDCGGRHCCALDDGDRPWCWGANDQGQLGNGQTESSHPEPDLTVWKSLCE